MSVLQLNIFVPDGKVMTLDTDTKTDYYDFTVDDKTYTYQFSLVTIKMVKQMYQPIEIVADIYIAMMDGNEWISIGRNDLETVFKHKQVGFVGGGEDLGDTFYVQEVIPEYYRDGMQLKLKIYSLDKLMTLKKTSRTFVGKRLAADILKDELDSFVKPYDTSDAGNGNNEKSANGFGGQNNTRNNTSSDEGNTLECNTANMQQLVYKSKKANAMVEHIFPYLVQYNESFYDMLARTTNRWGEFMYFEDGKLQLGYEMPDDSNIKKITLDKDFYKITYPNQDTYDTLTKDQKKGNYDYQALYDRTVDDFPVEADPFITRGEVLNWNGYGDMVLMRALSALLNNDKSLPSFIVDYGVDTFVRELKSDAFNSAMNDDIKGKYFPDKGTAEQYSKYNFLLYDDVYGEKDGFNEFTEMAAAYDNPDDAYTEVRYSKTFAEERKVSKNMAVIDYDTNWPGLVLGQVIDISGEKFIVAGITAEGDRSDDQGQAMQPKFRVTAIGQGADGKFYPAVLPTGHVRYSGPQRAKVADADDPTMYNRVRVIFPWQSDVLTFEDVDDTEKDLGDKIACCTPWIPYAAKGDGMPSTGRHTRGINVIVGFIDGNIERPYVLGSIQNLVPYDFTTDLDMTTPGEHYMRMNDGIGIGFQKFMSGIISPTGKAITSMIPDAQLPDFGNQRFLDGGFAIGDYFGIYKISGSSDDRNITISSPWGDVKMNAFTGITISAPNGDVKIKGKNITIEAGNNLKLVSGTNIKNKFLATDDSWPLTNVLDLTNAAATKILEEVGDLIDLTFLRHVVELVAKPIEGVTEIKSNRYLKLESGGTATGYPDTAYKDARALAYKKLKSNDWYKMGDGIGALLVAMGRFVGDWLNLYRSRYDAAFKAKQAFDQSIQKLRYYANLNQQEYGNATRVCNGYTELSDKLYNNQTEKITIKDLAFDKDKVGTASDALVSDDCFLRCRTKKSKVRVIRRDLSLDVLQKANALLKAIQAIKRMELSDGEINDRLGVFWKCFKHLPKDYMDAVKKAFSTEKCTARSTIYSTWTSIVNFEFTDNERNVLGGINFSLDLRTALKRLVSLNLLEEFGFSAKKAIPNTNPVRYEDNPTPLSNLFANENELLNNWNATISSIKLYNTLGSVDDDEEIDLAAVKERDVWSDAKSGKILFSSGGSPQLLDGTIQDIVSVYSKKKLNLTDALDFDEQEFERFNRDIKAALERLNDVQGGWEQLEEEQQANQQQGNLPIQPNPLPHEEQGGQGDQGGQGEQGDNQQAGNEQVNQGGVQVPVNNEVGVENHPVNENNGNNNELNDNNVNIDANVNNNDGNNANNGQQ